MKYIKKYNIITESISSGFKYDKETLEDFFVELLDDGWFIAEFKKFYYNSTPKNFDNSPTVFNNSCPGYYVEVCNEKYEGRDSNLYSADSIRKYSESMVEFYKSIASVSNKLERLIGEIMVTIQHENHVCFHIKEKKVLSFSDKEEQMDKFTLLIKDLLKYHLYEPEYKISVNDDEVTINFIDSEYPQITRGQFDTIKNKLVKLATGIRRHNFQWRGEFCNLLKYKYTMDYSYAKKFIKLKMNGVRV